MGFGEGFRGILRQFSGISRYITLFSRYITLFYAVLRYFTLFFDSMITYLTFKGNKELYGAILRLSKRLLLEYFGVFLEGLEGHIKAKTLVILASSGA